MKILTIFFLLGSITMSGIAQDEMRQFCTQDTSEHKKENTIQDGLFEVKLSRHGNYFKTERYKFMIPKDSLEKAFNVIAKVELSKSENGEYKKIGSFHTTDLRAPTTAGDPFEKGKYAITFGFSKRVEVWFNGDFIKLIYPKLTHEKYDLDQSFTHGFYIKKECYQDMLNAFKPKIK